MQTEMNVPKHVSIIMDGNGRWAQKRGEERIAGHSQGTESVRAVLEESIRLGVEYLSLYAFSEENWGRPEKEVSYLMNLMVESITKEFDTFMQNNIRFLVLGNREHLSGKMKETIDSAVEATAGNNRLTLIIFLSYSGKWDIIEGVKKFALEAANNPALISDLQIKDFDKYLVTAGIPDPDLIIRTSGEQRISNYLLWQGAYSEFYFTETLWPDFGKEEYRTAIKTYSLRERRYGKVKL